MDTFLALVHEEPESLGVFITKMRKLMYGDLCQAEQVLRSASYVPRSTRTTCANACRLLVTLLSLEPLHKTRENLRHVFDLYTMLSQSTTEKPYLTRRDKDAVLAAVVHPLRLLLRRFGDDAAEEVLLAPARSTTATAATNQTTSPPVPDWATALAQAKQKAATGQAADLAGLDDLFDTLQLGEVIKATTPVSCHKKAAADGPAQATSSQAISDAEVETALLLVPTLARLMKRPDEAPTTTTQRLLDMVDDDHVLLPEYIEQLIGAGALSITTAVDKGTITVKAARASEDYLQALAAGGFPLCEAVVVIKVPPRNRTPGSSDDRCAHAGCDTRQQPLRPADGGDAIVDMRNGTLGAFLRVSYKVTAAGHVPKIEDVVLAVTCAHVLPTGWFPANLHENEAYNRGLFYAHRSEEFDFAFLLPEDGPKDNRMLVNDEALLTYRQTKALQDSAPTVVKLGARTGLTIGRLTGVEDMYVSGTSRYLKALIIESPAGTAPFSLKGDSGSVIYLLDQDTNRLQPIGLLRAGYGRDDGQIDVTIASHYANTIGKLKTKVRNLRPNYVVCGAKLLLPTSEGQHNTPRYVNAPHAGHMAHACTADYA
eukprot:m.487603 g.487603  ORF g.487603 m.487603 type:complete len:598 (+) comp25152_c0_seq1:82-1875(+)